MLKAAIVYLQGSGGNLLARTLSLSEQTVAYLPMQYAEQQPTMEVSVDDRFKYYSNWKATNWTATETDIGIWYHAGILNFVNYETTEKWLIVCYADSSLEVIKKLAKLKRPDMNHIAQINSVEIGVFNSLLTQYPATQCIDWESMLDLTTYIIAIKKLATRLNLTLDYTAVEQLWTSWHSETQKVLNE